ncbi:MAG: formimidoylglutamate deiminase [Pelagibacterium sp. SCN 63-23]|nr:MAG: formimidoylglutamate deiminase [Pelagibacterium sp. SCN 63-23]
MRYLFDQALLPGGWEDMVTIDVDGSSIGTVATGGPVHRAGRRACVPGIVNLHSHAFQRGMAGLAERRSGNKDSFWTWRDVMYRFLDRLSPEDCRAVAAMAYVEMLESGFTRVVEFHYLHHDVDGRPYADIGEMAGQIAAAAAETGIGLTLLPVLYQYGNFGRSPAGHGQRRFLNDLDAFSRLLDASRKHLSSLPGANIGVAPHSLRAVDKPALDAVVALGHGGPIHMHIAEQPREVADSVAFSGARPVEWLLGNADVNADWCLIHATHMTGAETTGLAATGAVAGLCPVTEANLGDGIFAGSEWAGNGGSYGVGSDSNVAIGLVPELRLLEYSQRLKAGGRNMLADRFDSTGRSLFERAHAGGNRAADVSGGLETGLPASFVVLDLDTPALVSRGHDDVLDGWIFGHDRSPITSVVVNGREVVRDGVHVGREAIAPRYINTMQRLLSDL